jgi:type III secretion protein L
MRAMVVDGRSVRREQNPGAAVPSESERALRAREASEEEHRVRLARELAEARQRAATIVSDAEAEAGKLLEGAREGAMEIAARAARETEEAVQAKLAGTWLALRNFEERQVERELDRSVELAQLLAERLVGRTLDADPSMVAALARQVLEEARDARRTRVEVHPDDVACLRNAFSQGGLDETSGATIEVIANAALERGSLALRTELGGIDAMLHARVERLAAALREHLDTRGR